MSQQPGGEGVERGAAEEATGTPAAETETQAPAADQHSKEWGETDS